MASRVRLCVIVGATVSPMAGPPASLIYVMPESTVASVAELTLSPAPRTLRRVMVVRIELTSR